MKTIIFCGGQGTRLKEETEFKPKPLVSIGGKPLLWHIMKIYSHYGYNEFVLPLGYKGYQIKDYFLNQKAFLNDFTLDTKTGEARYHNGPEDNFSITFAETGLKTETGERLLNVKKHLTEDMFMVTYGDGVADIDINALVEFHKKQGTTGTLTGVHPFSKYGLLQIDKENNLVTGFDQKPRLHDYVSGGFMVFNANAFSYFKEGEAIEEGLKQMAAENELSVYFHDGFWQAVDTYREMEQLNALWENGKPWAIWE